MAKFVVDSEEVFEIEEAAPLMKISVPTLWRRIKDNTVVPLKLSGRTLITKSEIDRYNQDKNMAEPEK